MYTGFSFKNNLESFSLYRRKIYHDPLRSLLRIFKMFHVLKNNPVYTIFVTSKLHNKFWLSTKYSNMCSDGAVGLGAMNSEGCGFDFWWWPWNKAFGRTVSLWCTLCTVVYISVRGKGGRCLGLKILSLSCVYYLEILWVWTSLTLRSCPDL
jgi:hypothetical protein